MHRLIVATFLVLAPLAASAQDMNAYNQALASFNASKLEDAAPRFFELSVKATDADVRARSEYYLAQSLARKGMPVSALVIYARILDTGPSHPSYLQAVEGLVDVQQKLNEQNLVPNILDKAYTPEVQDQWVKLPKEVLARVHYQVATIRQRRGRFEEARSLLEAVPSDSRVFARASYLLGVVLADPHFPGRPTEADTLDAAALAAFRRALDAQGPQIGHDEVKQLALLGIGRVHYGRHEYPQAVAAYEAVPRYARFWEQALFENGFARFQGEDFGGALGSLQALHAPQFEGAFQPESWILKATVYYYSCLFDEVKTTLAAYDQLYEPMAKQLEPFVGEEVDLLSAYNLVAAENRRLPGPIYLWIRNNERIQDVMRMISQVDAEKRLANEQGPWRGTGLVPELGSSLEEVRGTLMQIGGRFAKSRLQEAAQNLRTFADQSEIIRVQTALDEKDLLLAGVDQKALLKKQSIYRPKMPGAAWNYWKFQGEFWRDEIGYYQYTLKRGCPTKLQGQK
ncbi:tetratricopeptide repeat protein [Archangium violaceum]|uniref:tetratricopeptide repeat protein n=1 Tax=Archangium violaceum TaxID=83451 RepID=UPI00193B5829|nr:tetratricopeptide repeat protein [Archangium violaceum]QRK06895.1 tetratricopeptide repeat protein [Archangium violaceum]